MTVRIAFSRARELVESFAVEDEPQVLPTGTRGELTVLDVDRSWSMSATDYGDCRLGAAIEAAQQFINAKAEAAPDDLIGAVAHDSSFVNVMQPLPARVARTAWRERASRLQPGDGTITASGLRGAERMFEATRATGRLRRIVLLTDGHGGRPFKIAQRLKASGVVIDAVGIGGSPADVDEDTLKRVASTLDGESRYRFIADAASLFAYFRRIATSIVK